MRKIERTILLPVLVVFLAVMTVVIISFLMSRNSIEKEADSNVKEYASATQGAVKDRLSIFEETLRAGLGLYAGGPVSKDQFSRFISTSAVLERYPGAQSVAYAKVVPQSSVDAFVAETRTTVNPEFQIKPSGQRAEYTPVVYIEPQSESNLQVVGFDVSSESTRVKALNQARDTGDVTISNAIQSLVDNTDSGRAFVMYAPEYKTGLPVDTVEQRRAAIEGYIYASFRVSRFMENVIKDDVSTDIAFSISIGDDPTILFRSDTYDVISSSSHQTAVSDLVIGSTTFHFTFVHDETGLLPSTSSRPLAVLAFGTLSALLVAGGVWLILRGKANELLLEQERGINEAKDNLLSLASHQLRTPATGVKQYVGMLIQGFAGKLTKQQQDLLEKAYAGNERQLKTINDVLYLARLGSGRVILSKSKFSVPQLVRDITRELYDEVNTKKHTINLDLPKGKKLFYGDEHMIRMAAENLLTNAIKYTRPGGTITVKVRQDTNGLRLSVKDSGVGIDKSQQARLFQQFERIENDLSIQVGGSGIGLYVVSNIAALHKGHVEVESEYSVGSEFILVLPNVLPG